MEKLNIRQLITMMEASGSWNKGEFYNIMMHQIEDKINELIDNYEQEISNHRGKQTSIDKTG